MNRLSHPGQLADHGVPHTRGDEPVSTAAAIAASTLGLGYSVMGDKVMGPVDETRPAAGKVLAKRKELEPKEPQALVATKKRRPEENETN